MDIMSNRVDGSLFKAAFLDDKDMQFYYSKFKMSKETVSPFVNVKEVDNYDYEKEIEKLKKARELHNDVL
jgi:hypothetical protein